MLIAKSESPEENFRLLHEAGCIQTLCDVYTDSNEAKKQGYIRFCQIMILTNLDPCPGCPIFPKCEAYKKYHTAPKEEKVKREAKIKDATTADNGPFGSMSVKQIAEKFGISKSEVRRLKVSGKLEALSESVYYPKGV